MEEEGRGRIMFKMNILGFQNLVKLSRKADLIYTVYTVQYNKMMLGY
jgi:hypothetical protein